MKCNGCRWCDSYNICLNSSNENYKQDMEEIELNICDGYYPNNELELFENEDNKTLRMDFDV